MLLFIDIKNEDTFELESWDWVASNGGLKKIVEQDLKRNFKYIYNDKAVKEGYGKISKEDSLKIKIIINKI